MNKKEPIIINDVDVSECEFFSSGLGYCTIGLLANDGTHICECEQNCHYKQLKRKEQECEKLNNTITNLENIRDEFSVKLDQLKVELKAEKNKLFLPTCYEQLYKETKEMNNYIAKKCFDLEKENKELKEKVNSYICSTNCYKHKENDKYRQALQEIKEIAKETSKFYPTKTLQQILQKCEVIDEHKI